MDCVLPDFGFGFNDVKFSDRTLRLQLRPVHETIAQSVRKRKRSCRSLVQESNGHDAAQTDENQSNEIKTLHISSIILAEKSPFFYKLFSNGMTESNQHHVTLRIQEPEEAAVMDLLKYMYTNTLASTTPSALFEVLMAADKYEVASCMTCCLRLLQQLPMTCELALLCLDFPSTISMVDTVQSLTDAAKEFLIARFKDVSKFEEEMLSLPLVGIEVVLSSDDLQVESEDLIYDFVMKWARRHYTKLDKRREILATRLHSLIRFPFMSCQALEKVLSCTYTDFKISSKLVFHALAFKIPHRHMSSVPLERSYKLRPVKVVRFESPHEECHVYLDLKHEECACLLPSGEFLSQKFELAEQEFYLVGEHSVNKQTSVHSFGFYLGKVELGSLGTKCEFSWRKNLKNEFVCLGKGSDDFTEITPYGSDNLFRVPWDTFMDVDSPYFINGVVRLRVVIQIKR